MIVNIWMDIIALIWVNPCVLHNINILQPRSLSIDCRLVNIQMISYRQNIESAERMVEVKPEAAHLED